MALHRLLSLLAVLLLLLLIASYNVSIVESNAPKKKRASGSDLPEPNQPLVAFRNFRIEIHNELENLILNTHCYSKDNDLGVHELFPEMQQRWSFKGNWLGRTNFHCRLDWRKGFLDFDAFYNFPEFVKNFCVNDPDDDSDVSVCVWTARMDGIYLTRYDGELVFALHWNLIERE